MDFNKVHLDDLILAMDSTIGIYLNLWSLADSKISDFSYNRENKVFIAMLESGQTKTFEMIYHDPEDNTITKIQCSFWLPAAVSGVGF